MKKKNPTESQLLKARVRALEWRVQSLARELEATNGRCGGNGSDVMMLQLDVKLFREEFGDYQDGITRSFMKMTGRVSDVAERVAAVEACLFESDGFLQKNNKTLRDVHRIIGPPNRKTPRKLDRPSDRPRRR